MSLAIFKFQTDRRAGHIMKHMSSTAKYFPWPESKQNLKNPHTGHIIPPYNSPLEHDQALPGGEADLSQPLQRVILLNLRLFRIAL